MATATKTAKTGAPRQRRARKAAQPATRARKQVAKRPAQPRKRASTPRTAKVNLPFMTAEFRAPDVHLPTPHMPSRTEMSGAINAARSNMPRPERLAFYTGLGVLALVGMIEWPVAAAIGAGALIAQRAVKRGSGERSAARAR